MHDSDVVPTGDEATQSASLNSGPTAPLTAPASNRDERGRYLPGHGIGGPGRAKRDTERAYLDALIGELTMDDWRDVIRKAIADAKEGDSVARNWLGKYVLPSNLEQLIEDGEAMPPINIVEYYRVEVTAERRAELEAAGAFSYGSQNRDIIDALDTDAPPPKPPLPPSQRIGTYVRDKDEDGPR